MSAMKDSVSPDRLAEIVQDMNDRDSHCRWCEAHQQYHGILYACPSYSEDVLLKIKADYDRWVRNLSDSEWVATQINNGVDPEVIEIYRALAGL